ncbi:glycosyltransferase [Frigidibacter mobilis]|uniref:Glycosyl transferase group 1 n=1 Tax=Frigidibacter mobilis TaxID=1335048 RepID=A0A159Z5M8_9RHOB|nr:glycosyltransferase [Frigidibacter mobilis]AMY70566.1 glycosyl transferase group 1 [Frigidibacter mobilis]
MNESAANRATLLLTTFKYPYAKGEPFLTAELPYLRQHFDRILVQPVIGMPEKRDLPEGFELCAPVYHEKGRKAFLAAGLLKPAVLLAAAREARRLAKTGHAVDMQRILVWAVTRHALERSEGVQRLLAARGPKAAYAYWGHTPALASGRLARAGIPFAVRFHRVDLYHYGAHTYVEGKSRPQSFPWREDIAAADRLIFISGHGRDYYGETWNVPDFDRKASVSRLGTSDAGHCGRARQPGDPFVLVSCSRISPVKQVHLIGQMAAEMAKLGRSVVWHHFGVGDHAPSLQVIEELKAQPGLDIRLHGWVQNPELMEFYRTTPVDLFANLSLSEGVPVSIMEAISFDIPVLATAVDGTPEAVVEGQSGFLCSLDEASCSPALARRIYQAMSQQETERTLAPRKLWEERFDAERNFAEHAADLAALAGRVVAT